MNKKLNDGTVLPSSLSMAPSASAKDMLMRNYDLKIGQVTDILYPEDKNNLSQKFIEYNVLVSEINANGNLGMNKYYNCTVNNAFGMSNNNMTFTLQPDKVEDGAIEFASLVLLLCISGQSSNGQAVIIGGFSHPDNPKYKKSDGQFYDFNFNGINYNINNDGEWTLTFNSPLDKKKKKKNEKAAGTQVKIDKEGRIKISDNEGQFIQLDRVAQTAIWSNGAESITIDKKNKKIALVSSGEMSNASTKAMSHSTDDALSLTSKKDGMMKSDANLALESKSNLSQKSGGNWEVKATGNVQVKAGGNVQIEGGTLAQLKGTQTLLGAGTAPVAIAGVSLAQGIGNLGAPVISTILTGSATVLAGT